MKKSFIALALVFLVLSGYQTAHGYRDPLGGFYLRGGIYRTPEFHTRIVGVLNRDQAQGNIMTASFLPGNDIGYTLGAEYLFDLSDKLKIGLGIIYNSKTDLERIYDNNLLRRRGYRQEERYEGFRNVPLYLSWRYDFPVKSSLQPYLLGRLGYSLNSMDGYSLGYYEEGPIVPPTGMPGIGTGEMVDRHAEARDLRDSPYYGAGFGVRLNKYFMVEGVYSYADLEFRLLYPTEFTDGSGQVHDFTVNEIHESGLHRFEVNLAYNYSAEYPFQDESSGKGDRWEPVRGLCVRVGANRNFTIVSKLIHHIELPSATGDVYSSQYAPTVPQSLLSPSLGVDYARQVITAGLELGGGVEYNFKRSFQKMQAQGSSYKPVYIEDLSQTVPYFTARYRFESPGNIEPYLVSRIGYSFNDLAFTKYENEQKLDYIGKTLNIGDGAYFGLGFGSMLTRHLFMEGVFTITTSHFEVEYTETIPQREVFDPVIRTIQINLGCRL